MRATGCRLHIVLSFINGTEHQVKLGKMETLSKAAVLTLAWFYTSLSLAAQTTISDENQLKVTVLAIGVDQSFDQSIVSLRYAESTARRFSELAGSDSSNTITSLLVGSTLNQIEVAMKAPAGSEPRDLLIVYLAGLCDDEGINLVDQKMSHRLFGQWLSEYPAKNKAVIMDRMVFGTAQPGKRSFRTGTYPLKGTNGEPIAYLIADADQLSAYEGHSIRSVNMSDIVISGLKGRADRDQNGTITWTEIISYTEMTLKYSLRPRSSGRMFLDHSEGSSQIPIHFKRRQKPGTADSLSGSLTDLAPVSSPPRSRLAPGWVLALDPNLAISQHRGFRDSEASGTFLALDLTAYRASLLGGDWTTGLEIQRHTHTLETDDANGTADYIGLSARVRARYLFSWETQDLRPQVGLGQIGTSQKLYSTRELGVIKSTALSPVLYYGIATHFFTTKSQLHGGLFFRRETLYGSYEGESQKFKASYLGLEIGYGGAAE